MKPMRVFRVILAIVVVLAAQSCTVKQNEAPELTGPSSFITPPPPAPPTAQFTFSPAVPAFGAPVSFDGSKSCPEAGFAGVCVLSDRVISSYNWDFGDGTTGSGPIVSHVYRTLGTFTVSLTVVNDRGLSSTASKSVPVGVGGTPPTAGFVFSPTNPTIGQSVSFNASLSKTGSNAIATYSWDFGDGGKAGGINPSHSFGNAGTYNVLLVVTDEAGLTATATQTVPVQSTPATPLPVADFVNSPNSPTSGQSVSFNGSTSKAATGHSIVSYAWNFGDGGTGSGQTPTHTFNSGGTFSVVLVVTDDLGQTGTAAKPVLVTSTGPTADFVFSPTNPIVAQPVSFNGSLSKAGAGHSIASYSWNFGDGPPAGTGVTPSHQFNNAGAFSVVLTVTDDVGQTGTVSKIVTVTTTPTDPPTASFVFSPAAPQVTQPVLFDATQSTAPQGHTLSYAWNFGDTFTGTGVSPSHPYANAGTYSVVLKVTDNTSLLTATVSKNVTVSAAGSTPPPTADFVFSPGSPQVNQPVLFDATQSTAPQGHTLSYAWNFGDTGTGTGVSPSHPYTSAGTFSVVLKVTDNTSLLTATVTKIVTVSAAGSTPPTADFVFSPGSPVVNQSVLFDASQSTVAQGHTLSYAWNFGDTGTGSGVTATHPYSSAGSFSVVLKVTDNTTFQTATTTKTVTVASPAPTASFVFSPTTPVTNQTVSFDASSSTASPPATIANYNWDFGDGSSPVSTGSNSTTHTFTAAGSFKVTLVVTDSAGQTGSKSVTVAVSQQIVAEFLFSPTDPAVGQTVFFDSTPSKPSTGASITSYTWDFGDGTSCLNNGTGCGAGTPQKPQHAFPGPPTNEWVVRLTIVDSNGKSATVTHNVKTKS